MQSFLPQYVAVDSPWHRMDQRWKLVGTIIALVLLPWVGTVGGAFFAFGACLALLATTRIPLRWWMDRLLGVGAFLLLMVVLLPLSVGETTWTLWGVGISEQGLHLAVLILLRSLAAIALALILFGTATFETTLHAATALRVPTPIIRIMLISWRYVQVMYQVIQDFRIALRLRGFHNRASWVTYRTISQVIGTMLIQGFDRAERVSQAMHCRGYQGRVASLETFRTQGTDMLLCALLAISGGIGLVWEAFFHQFA